MSEIQIGDRVRITNTDYDTDEDPNLANGQLATVIDLAARRAVLVRTDEGPRHVDPDGDGWCFFEHQLQVVEGEPK
ncbi:hypothetical protein [Stenotrophomonas maltophilia group sp. Smal35]|uniref:hypothetical protein n=1 Tax=Stenotrophomonas maltophilia group sp. Smal35 TaxID=3377163 RepID=UPI002557125D|nr:hypothetical protein [Stenotrophomonas maltophilia]